MIKKIVEMCKIFCLITRRNNTTIVDVIQAIFGLGIVLLIFYADYSMTFTTCQ